MNQVQKGTGVLPITKGILMGAVITVAVTVILCVLAAMLLSKELLPERSAQVMSWVIIGLATLPGSAAAMKIAGSARLPVSLCCAGSTLLFMAVGRAIMGSETTAAWQSAVVCIGVALTAAVLGAGRKGRRR